MGVVMFYKFSIFFILIIFFSITCFADVYTENFDVADNWSGSYGGYSGDGLYTDDSSDPTGDTFTFGTALRETTGQGGTHSGAYAIRLDDLSSAYFLYECDVNVTEFTIWIAHWDISDAMEVTIEYSVNSGSSYVNISTIDETWWTGSGLGDQEYKQFPSGTLSISPESGESVFIRLRTDGNERLMLDDLELTYTTGGAPDPTLTISHAGLTETNLDGASISLVLENDTFSDFGAGDITLNNAPIGTTVNTASNSDDTNATVTLNYNDADFDSDITDFNISVSADGLAGTSAVTSNNLTITAIIEPDPEPDNHVTDFEATANGSSAILLGWTDAAGDNLPSGYLIKINTSNDFSNPEDGTAIADDTSNLNVAYGEEIEEWIDLDAETEYFFKIFPYSNSGATIDYKTGGTVPVVSATTAAAPSYIAFCGFEDSGDTWSYTDNDPSRFGSWGIETSLNGISPNNGTYFWGMNDIDNLDTYYLTFDNVNIANYNDVEISFYWTALGFDNSDYLYYSISYDNGSSWETEIELHQGSGSNISWTEETISITNSETEVMLRLRGDQNGAADSGGWDDVSISGTLTSSAILTISHAGLTEINLDGASVALVLENDTFAAGLSSDHVTLYNEPGGTTINSVIRTDATHASVTLAFDETDFDSDIADFNIAVSADGLDGSDPVTSNNLSITAVVEPDPEPAAHVTGFDAAENGTDAILISWTDAAVASGYLIRINTEDSFTAPEDDTPIADGGTAKNITQGTEIYNWTGLDDDTQYFFKIWAYSNSGAEIDYKTDGEVPTANATTEALPDTPTLLISEVTDPDDIYQAKFIELFNAGDTDIDFDTQTWFVCRQTNGSGWEDKQLTGIIPATGVYVCAANNEDESDFFYSNFGFMADYDYGGSSGNGDDGYFLFMNGDHSSGTLVDAYGVIDDDGTGYAWEYTNSQAERLDSVSTPNAVWTASEWAISAADVVDVNPGSHSQGGVVHQTQNMGGGDSVTFPSGGSEEVTIDIDFDETGTVQVAVSISNENYPGAGNTYSGWWDIDINGNNEAVTFAFTYDDDELNGIDETSLAIYHLTDGVWENLGGTVDANNNTITLTGYTGTFSPFTLGDNEDTPLPITLSSFTAAYSSSRAILQWTTLSEMNNAGWNVYRAEIDDLAMSLRINTELISGQGTTLETSRYSFNDEYDVFEGFSYYYWLESISYSGVVEQYGPVMLTIPAEEEEDLPDVPDHYGLLANYPNPFNPTTMIRYNLPLAVNVQLSIYNVRGAKIKVLESGIKEAGYHQIGWNGTDKHGVEVGSGVYFYELVTPNYVKTRSMLLIK
jgi:FlgD Ig-like domain